MKKVFLAYKSADRDRAMVVRSKLEALDVDLFIDLKIGSGENYIAAINDQLESASAVLVLWTETSMRLPRANERNFVIGEAERGYNRNILVAATLDKIAQASLPVPFNMVQAPDISDWIGGGALAGHAGWQNLLDALGRKLERPALARLALALEEGTNEAKQAFLAEFFDDVSSTRIANEVEMFERGAFEEQARAAERRLARRQKENERKLKACRDEFDARMLLLRQGKGFRRPDFSKVLDPNIEELYDKVQKFEHDLQRSEQRTAQAEMAVAAATGVAAETDGRFKRLQQEHELLQRNAQTLAQDCAGAARDAEEKAREIETLKDENATLGKTLGDLQTEHDRSRSDARTLAQEKDNLTRGLEDKTHELDALRHEHMTLEQTVPRIVKRHAALGTAAALCALLIGLGAGRLVFPDGAGEATAQAASATVQAEEQIKSLKADLVRKGDEVAGLKKQMDGQNGQLVAVQDKARGLETQVSRMQKEAQDKDRAISTLQEQIKKRMDVTGSVQSTKPSAVKSSRQFTAYANYDMVGGAYLTQKDVTRDWCESECKSSDKCVAYTYDKWKNHCSLKDTVSDVMLEPRGDTAIRTDQSTPRKIGEQERFCSYNRKAFPNAASQTHTSASSKESCRFLCRRDQSCIAFTFIASADNTCRLFNTTTEPVDDPKASSEIKAQKPLSRWCSE